VEAHEADGGGAFECTASGGGDAVDLSLLEREYEYVTQSSFHTDELRDRFIQFYMLLAGIAFSIVIGLAQMENANPEPLAFAVVGVVVFLVGAGLVLIFVRLRRIVWECLLASVLIKEYFRKHAAHPDDLGNALFWDRATAPPQKEKWYSASSLLVLLIAILGSAMLGMALYFVLEQFQLLNEPFDHAAWLWSVALFAVSTAVQWTVYFRRVEKEKVRAIAQSGYLKKLEHFKAKQE
jgi:hypothetical protein